MKYISVSDVKRYFSRYLKEVAAGEEIVITRRGAPVARITGMPPKELRPGSPEMIAKFLAENPFPEQSRRSTEEIKRAIEEERNAWD